MRAPVCAIFMLAAGPLFAQLDLRIDGTEAALREALARLAAAGGGRITFSVRDAVIGIQDRIYFFGNNLILDGEDRNIAFKYTGPDPCNQTEGQDHFIEIRGNRNVIRNFIMDGFPDGVHITSGRDNLIENLRFPRICEDAVTNNGRGFEAFRTVIRGCYFQGAEDKAVMINNGGSVTVEDCEFVNCQQPVRAGGSSGNYVVRRCSFRGRSTGPRFSGGAEGMIVLFEDNVVEEASYGLRVYDRVQAIIRRNYIRPRAGGGMGIYVYGEARARLEANDIQGATRGGVVIRDSARVDLGGGRIIVCGDSEPSAGHNVLRGNRPAALVNETPVPVMAKYNFWDHKTVAEVLARDVSGAAEVEPLAVENGGGDAAGTGEAGAGLPRGYIRLMEAALANLDPKRLPAVPQARPQSHYYPGALLVAAVLYAKDHPANKRRADPLLLELALRLGDLLAAEYESGIYLQRRDHHRDTYMWLEAFRLLQAKLGAERSRRWRKALEALIGDMAADVAQRKDRPAYTSPFGVPTNHTALRASTVFLAGRVLQNAEWERLGAAVMRRYAQEQCPDGYWGEHSCAGPTTGYDFLTAAGVALYYEHSRDPAALKALRRSLDFHKYFTWPDGQPVMGIDDRRRHAYVSPWGHFGFSRFPDGRRYAEFLTAALPEDRLSMEHVGRLAQNALYYHEGPTAPIPQELPHFVYQMGVPAGIRKSGPWLVCLSGLISTQAVTSQYYLDRQAHLEVFHRRTGLIISGANSKRQPELATFYEKISEGLFHMPLDSRLRMSAEADRLSLAYNSFTADLTVAPPSDERLSFQFVVRRKSTPAEARLNIQLCLQPGQSVETAAGQHALASSRPLVLERLGGWIRHNAWTLRTAQEASFTWPVYPYNPYRRGPEEDPRYAVGVLSIPLHFKEAAEQRLSFAVEVPR